MQRGELGLPLAAGEVVRSSSVPIYCWQGQSLASARENTDLLAFILLVA